MARVIVVASGKGGVGKTTIAANLGIALSVHGEDVIVLDLDIAMANLELILGLEDKPVTLQEVLAGKDIIHNAIYEGPGGVRIVPAGLSLFGLKDMKLERLEEVLEVLTEDIDILLIDAPGGLERDALAALEVANELILVTTPEITSLSDALKTKIVAEKLGIDILGVVINKMRTDKAFLTTDEIEVILNLPVISVIPDDPELNKASASGNSIFTRNPNSKTSKILMNLSATVIGEYTYENDLTSEGIVSKFFQSIYSKYVNVYKS
ncbi:MAG: P-loop NTPase [Methanobacterium sp.]|uniref:cell division ATPase MinD n=1 Tax=Methanobacterium sp. TaxID=2164 RepID=UPI003D646634|nr:P-loop NTPase [Methanobacterium sp.]